MKLIISLAVLLTSQFAMAASAEALKAVLENSEVKGLTDISSLTVTNTYKCPQCYDVKVEGRQEIVSGIPQVAYLVVHTEGSVHSSEITTTVIERTK